LGLELLRQLSYGDAENERSEDHHHQQAASGLKDQHAMVRLKSLMIE
jgi:hypothetical protein